jgi:hypothetical protein
MTERPVQANSPPLAMRQFLFGKQLANRIVPTVNPIAVIEAVPA